MIVIHDSTLAVFRQVRELRRKGYRVVIMFSGGKDSTAMLDMCLRFLGSRNIDAIVLIEVAGNTHRICLETAQKIIEFYHEAFGIGDRFHIVRERYYCTKCGVRHDFYEYMLRHGLLPGPHARWCMRYFKTEPFQLFCRQCFGSVSRVVAVVGVKLSDSKFRSERYARAVGRVVRGTWLTSSSTEASTRGWRALPILEYSSQELWNYLKRVAQEVYSILREVYNRYGDVLNCVFCPFKNRAQILRLQNLPDYNEWKSKILTTLTKLLGFYTSEYSRKLAERWVKLLESSQTTLEEYIAEVHT